MNKTYTTANLVGFVQSVPGVCTFVRAVFETSEGQLCLQRTKNGRIVGWDVFERDGSVTFLKMDLRRSVDETAIVGYEISPGHMIIGDIVSLANRLLSDDASMARLEKDSPYTYEGILEFCSSVSEMKLKPESAPVIEERLLQAFKSNSSLRMGDPQRITSSALQSYAGTGKSYAATWLASALHDRIARATASSYTVLNHEINELVRFAQGSFAEDLIKEATLLLGQRLLAEKAVFEVFRKWCDKVAVFAVPSADLSSIRAVFRPYIYEASASTSSEDDRQNYDAITLASSPLLHYRSSSVVNHKYPDWRQLYYCSSVGSEYSRMFQSFRVKFPQEACLLYWIYEDNLSLKEVCQTTETRPDQALDLVRQSQKLLRQCLRYDGISYAKEFNVGDFLRFEGASVSEAKSHLPKIIDPWSVLIPGSTTDREELYGREIESVRTLMKTVVSSTRPNELSHGKTFPLVDTNVEAFSWHRQSKTH